MDLNHKSLENMRCKERWRELWFWDGAFLVVIP